MALLLVVTAVAIEIEVRGAVADTETDEAKAEPAVEAEGTELIGAMFPTAPLPIDCVSDKDDAVVDLR